MDKLEERVGADIQKRVIDLMSTEDGLEGVTLFQEKRKAKYTGK